MKKKIWVLSHHRTGSGFFCEILGNIIGVNLKEFLAPWKFDFEYIKNKKSLNFLPTWKFDQKNQTLHAPEQWLNFKSKWIDMPNIKMPNSAKIHYDTLKIIFGDFSSFKEKIGTSACFIKTSRKDILNHAVSLYTAIYLNKWRIESFSDKQGNWDNKKIQINDRNLMACYNYILNTNSCWDCVDVPFINVYYEDLISNPIKEIKKVLNFLEINFPEEQISNSILSSNEKMIKQTHQDKEKILIRLKKLVKKF